VRTMLAFGFAQTIHQPTGRNLGRMQAYGDPTAWMHRSAAEIQTVYPRMLVGIAPKGRKNRI
jgi:hypothetical protein